MKVKVIKCKNSEYWYNDMLNWVFDVELTRNKEDYRIIDWKNYIDQDDERSGVCGLYVSVEDAIEVSEENTESENLLLEMCNLSLFERKANEYANRVEKYPGLLREVKELKQKNMLLLERLHQCKKSHRENKDKLIGKIYKILRRNK